jgi:hypothetical protein
MIGAAPRHGRARFPVLIGLLTLFLPVLAFAQKICSETGRVIDVIGYAVKTNLDHYRNQLEAAKAKPETFVQRCVQLKEKLARATPSISPEVQKALLESEDLPLPQLYRECRTNACSGQDFSILTLLEDAWPQVQQELCGNSEQDCNTLKPPPRQGPTTNVSPPQRPSLPRWRKGLGGALIAGGGVSLILGAVQMGVPFFHTDTGCVQYGLDLPCTADRFGLGGALLGLGLVAAGGGILTLTLP